MARSQLRANRKASGGKYKNTNSKKKTELARNPTMTRLSEKQKIKTMRVLGGNNKNLILSGNQINVANKKGEIKKTVITNVVENEANPHMVRRNILTKGAIVETSLGKAKITSRPGQQASLSGTLVE